MNLGPDDVHRIAALAKLALEDDEVEEVTGNLKRIFDFVEQLQAVDTTGVEPMAHPLGDLTQRLRADVVSHRDEHERWQQNAADVSDGFYRVPKVIE